MTTTITSPQQPPTQILLLGAGELGTAFLTHLSPLPNTHITLAVRNPTKYDSHPLISNNPNSNITLLPLDTTSPSPSLSSTFSAYDILISATGFGQPLGTVSKLLHEVLGAGRLRKQKGLGKLWFFPWQWGVDYDVTGDGEGMMPLFGEQKQVRQVLREEAQEANVAWTIVSTGIFMSFLFEGFGGVVDREAKKDAGKVVVRALGGWDHGVTVTDVGDIGKVLARIVARDMEAEDRCVYVAGDSVSYGELASIVEKVTGQEVERERWSIPYLEGELQKDPENGLAKYRLVFAREGVWWSKEGTVNHKLGIPVMDVETYARNNVFAK